VVQARRRPVTRASFDPLEEVAMARVVRRCRDGVLGELPGFFEVAETRDAVSEGGGDLVLERLHPMRVPQVMLCIHRTLESDVEKVTEVVMVPGVLRRDQERASVSGHGRSEVAEECLAETHQRVHDIVVPTMRSDTSQVQRRLPRIRLDAQLGEVTMCEERVLSLVAHDFEELSQERGDVRGVCALGEGVFGEPSEPFRVVRSTAHARLV
jgi:hypothetical protein